VVSPSVLNTALQAKDFTTFTQGLEYGYHGQVHVALGGHMEQTDSPMVPLFFMHHCKVDQVWYMWQKSHPTAKFVGESLTNPLINYPSVRISEMIDTMNPKLCYVYDTFTGRVPSPAPPPTPVRPPAVVPKPPPPPPIIPQQPQWQNPWNIFQQWPQPVQIFRRAYIPDPVDDKKCMGEVLEQVYPLPLSEAWIKLNGYNRSAVQSMEASTKKLVDRLNSLKGFISPMAMVNDRVALGKLFELKANVTADMPVTCRIYEKKTKVPVGKTLNDTVNNLIKMITKAKRKVEPPTVDQLMAIIGKPALPLESAANPFRGCRDFDSLLASSTPPPKPPTAEAASNNDNDNDGDNDGDNEDEDEGGDDYGEASDY